MKKMVFTLVLLAAAGFMKLFPQQESGYEAFLITCSPGTETYSIYGHSALRITNNSEKKDSVYNWGVFDFSTPHFVWKFAKGRLNYMLDASSLKNFLEDYYIEKRSVYEQKINFEPDEIQKLLFLIRENMKPENKYYRYDFFYDDCSTRIRDIIEKSAGGRIAYPMASEKNQPSFRDKVTEYQMSYPWLNFGIDLIMGTPGEKKASYRDRMFLPLDLQNELSEAIINRDGRLVPLLRNPMTLVRFEPAQVKQSFLETPIFLFSLLFILILAILSAFRGKTINRIADITIFSLYSALALLMIFFNFFTDHIEMQRNLNILWLNPIIPICLAAVILDKKWQAWFRIVFYLSIISFAIQIIFPHGFNSAFIPLLLILMVRSSARAGFSWNPLSV
ncbi:MAG: DUF4105 domain-containing protein [Bacteroidales bacterium]|jgi:hypothetical protein